MNTIQATELRIGNFIGMNLEEYPNNFFTALEIGETMKVYEGLITLKGASIKRVETSFMYVDDFEPIPLNEDWLKKFGFQFDGGDGYLSPNGTLHWWFSLRNGFMPAIYRHTIETDLVKGVKYVHQLQNLYFALTTTELTLTDK